jgi:hypothetical protein
VLIYAALAGQPDVNLVVAGLTGLMGVSDRRVFCPEPRLAIAIK